MSTSANPIAFSAEIESIRAQMPEGVSEDFRVFAEGLVNAIQQISPNALRLNAVGTTATQSTPSGISMRVTGSNGVYTIAIDNGNQNNRTVWHEISYSTSKIFTSNVTVMPVTTATSLTVNDAGATYYFRRRSSFDQVNWSAYTLASTSSVSSGLVSSSATAAGAAFNQTNYGVVSSSASGSTADVEISGANGPLTSLVAVKGQNLSVLPSATISNVPAGSTQFVAWNGSNYVLRPTLAAVLADNLTPIGKVSVVNAGTPRLPTIVPIVQGGGIVGYDVTDGGEGATGNYTLTLGNAGSGTGATFGTQTIVNGVLISVAAGNAGRNYSGSTTVAASGGVGSGTPGGGTAAGGNGGRMTAV